MTRTTIETFIAEKEAHEVKVNDPSQTSGWVFILFKRKLFKALTMLFMVNCWYSTVNSVKIMGTSTCITQPQHFKFLCIEYVM